MNSTAVCTGYPAFLFLVAAGNGDSACFLDLRYPCHRHEYQSQRDFSGRQSGCRLNTGNHRNQHCGASASLSFAFAHYFMRAALSCLALFFHTGTW